MVSELLHLACYFLFLGGVVLPVASLGCPGTAVECFPRAGSVGRSSLRQRGISQGWAGASRVTLKQRKTSQGLMGLAGPHHVGGALPVARQGLP